MTAVEAEGSPTGREVRVVLIADDLDAAVRFYGDALGLPIEATWDDDGGGVVFAAGRATLEILSAEHADMVDRVEVGQAQGPGVLRLALEVRDADSTVADLVAAGAERLGGKMTYRYGVRVARERDQSPAYDPDR